MTSIIFFGGFGSTEHDVGLWKASALSQHPDLDIECYPYPPYTTASEPLAHWKSSSLIARNLATLENVYIVGHSSGCAIANDVAEKAHEQGSTNFHLIALDGFRPSTELQHISKTQCWSASCRGIHSLNYSTMKDSVNFHVFQAQNCRTHWALHFSICNRAANDDIVRNINTGYNRCKANLCWLNTEEIAKEIETDDPPRIVVLRPRS